MQKHKELGLIIVAHLTLQNYDLIKMEGKEDHSRANQRNDEEQF